MFYLSIGKEADFQLDSDMPTSAPSLLCVCPQLDTDGAVSYRAPCPHAAAALILMLCVWNQILTGIKKQTNPKSWSAADVLK